MEIRQHREKQTEDITLLENVFHTLKENYPEEWLLYLEIYELLLSKKNKTFKDQVLFHLEDIATKKPFGHLIHAGLKIINT